MKLKRCIGFSLSVIMMFANLNVVFAEAIADDTYTVINEDSENIITYPVEGGNIYIDKTTGYVAGSDETVTGMNIPESVEGVAIVGIENVAMPNGLENSYLTSVTIPKTVIDISTVAFTDQYYLREINVAEGNPVYKSIDGVLYDYVGDDLDLIQYPIGKECDNYVFTENVFTAEDLFTNNDVMEVDGIRYGDLKTKNFTFLGMDTLIYFPGCKTELDAPNITTIYCYKGSMIEYSYLENLEWAQNRGDYFPYRLVYLDDKTDTTTELTTEKQSETTTRATTTTEKQTETTTKATTTTEKQIEATTKESVTTTEKQTETTTSETTETTTRVYYQGSGSGSGGSLKRISTTTTEVTTEVTTKAVTEGKTETTTLAVVISDVKVTIGSRKVEIGDKVYEIDVAPYIQSDSNSTLVPLRFVALAIAGGNIDNIDNSKNIMWDVVTKTATISYNNSTIKFTAGSADMVINGKTQLMENGVKAEIAEDRMFVPFRALGKALGVQVEWNADTNTAIYRTILK